MKGKKKKMKHAVRTFNKAGKCLYEKEFRTAEAAYEEYVNDIRILKSRLEKGEEITIARFNEGYVMTIETIKG